MASCECCWSASRYRSLTDEEAYGKVLCEHQERGCVCTKNTPAGDRARAGQFWNHKLGRDERYAEEEWKAKMAARAALAALENEEP